MDTPSMETVTLRVEADTLEAVDEEAEERGLSRSEYVRQVLGRRDEYEEVCEELERVRRELERSRREKRQILEQREEKKELQRYVDDELSYREASLSKRARWWLFGKGGE